MINSKLLLRIAASISFAVALFQTVISFVPSWSLYFGAPAELVSHALLLSIAGMGAAVVFALFGLYALSGAGDIRALPLLRIGLVTIGIVYTVRGLLLIPELLILKHILQSTETIPPQAVISSLVALLIGVLYLTGIFIGWSGLNKSMKR